MIRFNVEDILALPQLKSGKFTKNIGDIELTSTANEIVDIMEFQSSSKGVDVKVYFEHFPLQKDGKIVLSLDQQRF